MSLLATLKLDKYAAADGQPFQQSPVARQANPVQAPTIQVQHAGTPGANAPSVSPSPGGNIVVDHTANPLTPAVTPPQGPQIHNGQVLTPEQYVQTVTQEQAAAAEAAKNAPKEPKAPPVVKQDMPLHDSLVESWKTRIKSASSPLFEARDPVTHSWFGANGRPGGYMPDLSYNPFSAASSPVLHPMYAIAKKMALGKLLNVAPKMGPNLDDVSEPWTQRYASNYANFGTVNGPNPLAAMAANMGSYLGGHAPAEGLQQQYGPGVSDFASRFS